MLSFIEIFYILEMIISKWSTADLLYGGKGYWYWFINTCTSPIIFNFFPRLEVESSKLKDCKNAEEISVTKAKVETLHNELKLKQ